MTRESTRMTSTRVDALASALAVAHGIAPDVARAAIEAVASTRARAVPMDVVVSLNLRDAFDGERDDLSESEAALARAFVEACPNVFLAFARTAHADGKGRVRCSKFARGVGEEDAAACAAWRSRTLSSERLALDDEKAVIGGVKARGGRGVGGGKRVDRVSGSAAPKAAPKATAAPKAAPPTPAPWIAAAPKESSVGAEEKTSLRDIMDMESRRATRAAGSSVSETSGHKVAAPKLPVITAELLRSEARRSPMDKFGKIRCQVCGRMFKAYDALEQHIGASHYGLNNPYAKVLEAAQIAAGLVPTGDDGKSRVSLKLGDLVSSTTKTSNSMVNSLAAYFKTERATSQRTEKKEGNVRGGQLVRSTNMASTSGLVLRRGVERRDGKKKKRSTLKKIILAERAMRRETATNEIVEEEVEVEVEVLVGHVYVRPEYVDDGTIRVRLLCMDDESDDDEASSEDEAEVVDKVEEDDRQATQEKLDVVEARAPAGAWGVRRLLDVLKGTEVKATKEPKVKQEARTCEICDVQCFGERAWEAHVAGKSHAKKLSMKNDPEAAKKAALNARSTLTYVGVEGAENIRYTNQIITDELNEATTALLTTLKRFQDRLYHTDKIKAKLRRRLLYGLREVAKSVDARTSKVVIIAPNIEQIESEGGLDDRIKLIIEDAREKEVPVVFALTKRRIGKALNIQAVSVVSVLDYNGADEEYKKTLALAAEGRELFVKLKHKAPSPPSLNLAAREFVPGVA